MAVNKVYGSTVLNILPWRIHPFVCVCFTLLFRCQFSPHLVHIQINHILCFLHNEISTSFLCCVTASLNICILIFLCDSHTNGFSLLLPCLYHHVPLSQGFLTLIILFFKTDSSKMTANAVNMDYCCLKDHTKAMGPLPML